MNFGRLRVIELSYKIWISFSMGNFVSHIRGHQGPANLVKVPEILESYIIFGMFLLVFRLPQVSHLIFNG